MKLLPSQIKKNKRKEKDEICTDVKNYIRRLESFSNPLIAHKTLLYIYIYIYVTVGFS